MAANLMFVSDWQMANEADQEDRHGRQGKNIKGPPPNGSQGNGRRGENK